MTYFTIKDHTAESRRFARRIGWAMAAVMLGVLALVARLAHLQILSHEHFATLSQENRVKVIAVPPLRGMIYDRNGVLIAGNQPSFHLEVIPEQVKDMAATLTALGNLLEITESDLKRFHTLRRRMPRFQGIPLRLHLNDEEIGRFAVNRHLFPGVDIVAALSRSYPLGEHAAHVAGYVGRIDEDELQQLDVANYSGTSHVGKIGIEKSYESVLHGQVGYQHVETNAQGRLLRVLERVAPTPGKNLFLTIDMRLQMAAEEALGEYTGAVVAIDPNTGEVLAMVSKPGFDPNPFVNGIDAKQYTALQEHEDRPLYNRALRGQYPPGSTMKPFIGLAGLEYGVIHPDRPIYCPGFYQLPGNEHRYRDWKKEGHGSVDFERAIVESCDVYFYDLAREMGIDRLHDFQSRFGFGTKSGIDVGGELAGLAPSREWKRAARGQAWFPGETLITGIGQGYTLITPLQLASATATLAMRGKRFAPRLMFAVQDPDTREVERQQPVALDPVPVKDPANWDRAVAAMVEVVHGARGTARASAAGAPYRYAGKTGTAQVFGVKQDEKYDEKKVAEKLRDHALFIAFAPADAPRLAVAVIVENGGHGGSVAAPIARKVFDAYLLGGNP